MVEWALEQIGRENDDLLCSAALKHAVGVRRCMLLTRKHAGGMRRLPRAKVRLEEANDGGQSCLSSPFAGVAAADVDFKDRCHRSKREPSGSGNASARSPY